MKTIEIPIYEPVLKLATVLPYYVDKMPSFYKNNYGIKLIDYSIDFLNYVDLANKEEVLSKREGLLKTLIHKIFCFKTVMKICETLSHRGTLIIDDKSGEIENFKDANQIFTAKQFANIAILVESISKQASGWLIKTAETKSLQKSDCHAR